MDDKTNVVPVVTEPVVPAPAPAPEKTKEDLEKELSQAQHTIIELKKKKDEVPPVVAAPAPAVDTVEKVKADLAAKEKELNDAKLTISELKQSGISKKTQNVSGSATGQDLGNEVGGMTEEMLTPMDRKIMARAGITLKDINKNK